MSIIGAGPVSLPATSSSYSPLGKPAVGFQSADTKNQTLPPVEESAHVDKARDQASDNKSSAKKTGAVAAASGKDGKTASSTTDVTEAETQNIHELASVDREVRAHEAAHAAVGGNLAGSPSFRFVTGPDGQKYAVGGEVSITLAPVASDPDATLRNAEQVRAAALAPARPSAQDLQVAAAAAQVVVETQLQLTVQRSKALAASGSTPINGARATNAFKQAAGTDDRPGSLLDQHA